MFDDGKLAYGKYVVTISTCSMDFTFFPVDQQNCSFFIGNFFDSSLHYQWFHSDHFNYNDKIFLPNQRLIGYSTRADFYNDYPAVWVDIFISRNVLFFLARFYLPALIVVIIAFLPLYLTPNSHSKVGLGVAVMLTMVTLITNTSSDLPKIDSLTALDVYMFFCFFSVFLAVVEYSLVGYYELVLGRVEEKSSKIDNAECERNPNREKTKTAAVKQSWAVDFISRRLFPVVFVLFNLVYTVVMATVYVKNKQGDIKYRL